MSPELRSTAGHPAHRTWALIAAASLCLLAACAQIPSARHPDTTGTQPAQASTSPPPTEPATLEPARFEDLPGWSTDDLAAGLRAFAAGCPALSAQPTWTAVCAKAQTVLAHKDSARAFLETWFLPYRVTGDGGTADGLVTGYYEPLLHGSRIPDERYRYPLYAPPDDLVTVDLADVVPESRNLRLKGRLSGRKLVPYWSRAEIESGRAPVAGRELLWVDDPIDLFFLQIQGSGRVRLADGSRVRVGYADQNGHPYRSIGRLLVERGELRLEDASMQGIKAWARANPDRLSSLLDENPSFVFFRELPAGDGGPPGALGVPLTPERSIAIDPRRIPLGAPVFLDTTQPGSPEPLRRLVAAQDTGGAIKGAVRADYFWGFGDNAGALAGRMRQPLRMWVLLPRAESPR